MVFRIIPVRPNRREVYQQQVLQLCHLLKDDEGRRYRFHVFRLLGIPAVAMKGLRIRGLGKFREHPQAKLFLRYYPADLKALEIMSELDGIYGAPVGQIDHLRGAVGEVFSYLVCRATYRAADIEVQVQIGAWTSGSIDTAGCSHRRGHCLQSKSSSRDIRSIVSQKRDLDAIEQLTGGKANGTFVTFEDRQAFYMSLRTRGIDASTYKVLDRSDMVAMEERLQT